MIDALGWAVNVLALTMALPSWSDKRRDQSTRARGQSERSHIVIRVSTGHMHMSCCLRRGESARSRGVRHRWVGGQGNDVGEGT